MTGWGRSNTERSHAWAGGGLSGEHAGWPQEGTGDTKEELVGSEGIGGHSTVIAHVNRMLWGGVEI